MPAREILEHALSFCTEAQVHDARIVGGGPARDQAEPLAARRERDHAVMLCLQPLRQSADRCPIFERITSDLQQQLILQRRQTVALHQLFAMPHEAAKLIAKIRERPVLP